MSTLTKDGPVTHAEDVLSSLREQADLYGRLETVSLKQRALVARDDTGPLLALLADRQRVSMELQRIAKHFEPVRRDWPSVRRRLSPEQRSEADALLAEIKGRLQRVMEGDAQDARVLSAKKQAVAKAMRATHATGQAISAYRSSDGAGAADRLDEAS